MAERVAFEAAPVAFEAAPVALGGGAHPSALIGSLAASYGVIELGKQLRSASAGGGPGLATLEGRELYIDADHHQQYLTTLHRNPRCRFDHVTWPFERALVATLGDVFALAGDVMDVRLQREGEPFVRAWVCAGCGRATPCFALLSRAQQTAPLCKSCGAPNVVTGFQQTDWLSRSELPAHILAASCSELGLREGDVVTLSEASRNSRCIELAFAPVADGADARVRQRVVLVGCGNIGSHAASQIARVAGRSFGTIDHLLLADPDFYQEHNVANQDVTPCDVGRAKVDVQAERVRAVNPQLAVEAATSRIEELPLGRLRGAVLLGAVDSREARQRINQLAWRVGASWIDMAVSAEALLCRVSSYRPGPDAACLECGWDDADYAALGQKLPCELS